MTKYRYQEIYSDLKVKILHGVYKSGEFLPSENELKKLYKANRSTLRNAIALLESEGIIVKQQGKRSVIDDPRRWGKVSVTKQDFDKLLSFELSEEERKEALEHKDENSIYSKVLEYLSIIDSLR